MSFISAAFGRLRESFEWDEEKNRVNFIKHNVYFYEAQKAFFDPSRVILQDLDHSNEDEERYFCVGKIDDNIMTVRFTFRNNKIRIFGAGFWRKGKMLYEQQNKL